MLSSSALSPKILAHKGKMLNEIVAFRPHNTLNNFGGFRQVTSFPGSLLIYPKEESLGTRLSNYCAQACAQGIMSLPIRNENGL